MRPALIDTSAWIEALRKDGQAEIREQVVAATTSGRACLCDLVRLELWNGARGRAERRMIADLERELPSVPTSPEVWTEAIELARACRKRGVTVPSTDLLIVACARHHGLDLVHCDAHFDRLAEAIEG